MNTPSWYSQLIKPSWAPPSWIFSPVWMVLYGIIVFSFSTVFYKAFEGQITWMVALPFILNLIFNLAFVPIQFGLKNNLLASIDIVLVLSTLIWAFIAIWGALPYFQWIVYTNIPYFLWVTFATVLQLNITFLNK